MLEIVAPVVQVELLQVACAEMKLNIRHFEFGRGADKGAAGERELRSRTRAEKGGAQETRDK